MQIRYWSLSQHGHLQPYPKPKAWQLHQVHNCKMAYLSVVKLKQSNYSAIYIKNQNRDLLQEANETTKQKQTN